MKKEVVVISLGGSVVVPNKINIKFLKEFKKVVKKYLTKYKFVLIVGGGRTAREYQQAASAVTKLNPEDLDWLGIHATRLNAHLLRTVFRDVAKPAIVKNPKGKFRFDKVLIAAGWEPGWSTDYDAVLLAKSVGANTVVNMTNVDYLHDKDPRTNKNARKIEKTNWKGFRKIVGSKWTPGLNAPFDPVASKLAQRAGMKLVLIGNKLDNFKNFLDKKEFKGSIVE